MLEAGGIVYQEIKTSSVSLTSGVAAVQIPIQIEVFFLPFSLSIKITYQRARTNRAKSPHRKVKGSATYPT
jgi:hypothetical protein